MVWWDWKRWSVPSSMHSAITPLHAPSLSMIRSSAKYSTKNWMSCFMAAP